MITLVRNKVEEETQNRKTFNYSIQMHLKIVFSPSGSKHVREIESIKWLSRRLHMVFECVGFGHEYSVSFKNVTK